MKLLVIVLCLLSERFLVHVSSHNRFQWFSTYGKAMEKQLSQLSFLSTPWLMLAFVLLPMVLLTTIVLYFCGHWVFGFAGLLLNVLIFYFCMGPGNPFYPARASKNENPSDKDIRTYLAAINEELFAVIFWYIILGPVAVLTYRLITLSQNGRTVKKPATWLTHLLDWAPARMTVLLYLLVGNFQAGFRHFSKLFFSQPKNNTLLLSDCGMHALDGGEALSMQKAECLVEHALIALLVLLACFTLVAWI